MKRHLPACDADYDVSSDPTAQQSKRQKLLESDGKLHVSWQVLCYCVKFSVVTVAGICSSVGGGAGAGGEYR